MKGRFEAKVGILLVVLAAGLAFLRFGRPETRDPDGREVPKAKAAAFTNSERLSTKERLKRVHRLLAERKSGDLLQEDYDLVRGLPEESLMELLDEYSADVGQSYLLIVMFQRLGEIAGGDGIDWAMKLDEVSNSGYRGLVALKMMEGWALRDPVGALSKAYDPDFYSIVPPVDTFSGDPVFRPPSGLVAKSAAADPEKTWEMLLRGRRKEQGKDFFELLSPKQAKFYAARIPELLADPERPGFELFGGIEDDPGGNRTSEAFVGATTAAAKAWFVGEPDKALAWYIREIPPVEQSVSGIGVKAGQLISRLAVENPDRAMKWARTQSKEIRRGLASELANILTAQNASQELNDQRLEEVVGWMHEPQH